jgi:hypothetical protein
MPGTLLTVPKLPLGPARWSWLRFGRQTPQIVCSSVAGTACSGVLSSTAAATPVVVGPQVVLTGSPTGAELDDLPVPLTLVPPTAWTVGGTNIGGYGPSTAGASVTETTLTGSTLTTYWVYPGTFPVTYESCVESQATSPALFDCTTATASFTVSGVSSPAINIANELLATIDDLTGCAAASGGPTLVYGSLQGPAAACGTATGNPGITFYPVGTPPGAGSFLFAQIVENNSTTYTDGTGATTCTWTAGVDGQYPYQGQINPSSTSDSPETSLPQTFTPITRNLVAWMYLLWQPAPAATSIPVPLGYMPWAFNGTATNVGTTQAPIWTASGTGAPVTANGQATAEGVIEAGEAIPDAGSPNSAFVPAATIADIPVWNGPAIPAAANCPTN